MESALIQIVQIVLSIKIQIGEIDYMGTFIRKIEAILYLEQAYLVFYLKQIL